MRSFLRFLKVFCVLIAVSHAIPIENDLFLESDAPICSTDVSQAYLDIILMIDTSANMGTANLRKISTLLVLALNGFPIGNQVDITAGQKNTRVTVVAYDQQATIVANYTQINSVGDLNTVLNGLNASTSTEANLPDAFSKSFYIITNCTDPSNCSYCVAYQRPTAFLIFAASSNINSSVNLPQVARYAKFYADGTFITVNFNPSDSALTYLLGNFTWNFGYNMSMFNYLGSSNTLTRDISFALSQANCYCDGAQLIYMDTANNRYAYSRGCIMLYVWATVPQNITQIQMCSSQGVQSIPAFVLSADKTKVIQQSYGLNPPYYIGLHKNAQGQWVWWDYDLTEFPLGTYTNWDVGYPLNNANDSCAIIDYGNTTLAWKNQLCDPSKVGWNGLGNIMCQSQACDTTSFSCCQQCNGVTGKVCKANLDYSTSKHANRSPYKQRNGNPRVK